MPADRKHPRKSDPALCDYCGVMVSRGTDLPRHKQKHLSPVQRAAFEYRCTVSGCKFKSLQKSNLQTHMNTHTKKKPYKCPTCILSFGDPGSLTRHRKRAHKYKPRQRNQYVANNTRKKSMAIADSPESGFDSGTETITPTATSPSTSELSSPSTSPPVSPTSMNYVAPPVLGPVQRLSIPRKLAPIRTHSETRILPGVDAMLSPPVSPASLIYIASPVLEPVQRLGIPRILAPTRTHSEPRTLPGVDAMLAGAPHWQLNTPLHDSDERHPRASASAAAFNSPLLPGLSAYTYPPPLPPIQYNRLGRSTLTNPS